MGYASYVGGQLDGKITPSAAESRASGLAVGRMDVHPAGSITGVEIAERVEADDYDLVILRYPADDVDVAAQLASSDLICWQADTLLYFEAKLDRVIGAPPSIELDGLVAGDETSTDALVSRVFGDYRNHYSGNPALARIDVVAAYQEWTKTCLTRSTCHVDRALASDGREVGLCVVDVQSPSFDEVLLAGIVPEERRHGRYHEMMRAALARSADAGKESVVISTQASNIGVMRAWCRLGFLPTVALNTVHVMKRSTFPFRPIGGAMAS